MSPSDELLWHRDGGTGRLTLNRPDRRNAITLAMWRRLAEIAAEAAATADLRLVLIDAAGAGVFSAGADIAEFATAYGDAETAAATNAAIRRALAAVEALPMPVVTLVRGACIGGGCALALAGDVVLASSSARFAITPAKLGLAYSLPDTRALVLRVGPARAKEMLLTGRLLDASDALDIGLVDRVWPEEAFAAEVETWLAALLAASPVSQRAIKATVRAIGQGAVAETAETRALFDAAFASADFEEGRTAFLAKRPPRFNGR